MKAIYHFVTGDVTIDVDDAWGQVLVEQNRLIRNNDRRETRRHKSLDRLMNEMGAQFAARYDAENDELNDVLDRLPKQQRELIRQVFYEGIPMASIARNEGTSHTAIRKRLKYALCKLQENL